MCWLCNLIAMPNNVAVIKELLVSLASKGDKFMATLDQVLELVTKENGDLDGIKTLITGLKQQVADAMAGILNPDQQAKLDAIFDQGTAGAAKIAEALQANVAAKAPKA